VPYWSTFGHDYVMDDGVYFAKNPAVTAGARLGAYFTDKRTTASRVDFLTISYRPLRTLAARAIYASGFGTRGFGAVNLALYALAVALFAALALHLSGRDRAAALVATALWASLPVHVEAVAYYSALGDLLSLVCELASLLLAGRAIARAARAWPSALASLALAALALLTKEMAISECVILAIGAAASWRHLLRDARRRAVALVVAHVALAAGYLVAHHLVAGSLAQGAIVPGEVARALLRAPVYLWTYVAIIASPVAHAAAYPHVRAGAATIALAWLGAAAVAVLLWRARRPALTLAVAGFAVTLAPVLHLVPLQSSYADRFALVPSVGLALAVAVAVAAMAGRARTVALVAVALVAAVEVAATARQARVWQNDATLWQASAAAQPRSGSAHANWGLALLRAHRPAEALAEFQAADTLDGASAAVLVGSAAAHDLLGHAAAADAAARAAVAADDSDARAHAILGSVEARRGDLDGAAHEAARALALNPELASAWTLRAHLDEVRGHPTDAAVAWRRAAALVPGNADYQAEAARLSLVTGDRAAAAAAARACLALRPDDARCRALLARANSP
jgi:protein O-mannosyl-transferase